MKFRNKFIGATIAFLVIFQAFMTYVPINASTDWGNIFDLETFTINGETIEDGDFIEITEGMRAEFSFTWDTERVDGNVLAGDTAHAPFSPAFKTVNISEQPILTQGDDGQVDVGVYWIENGVLYFKFNEKIEDARISEGTLSLGLEFDLEEIEDNRELQLPFIDTHDGDTIEIVAKPKVVPTETAIKVADVETKENTQEIKWTIEVMNTTELDQLNTILSDQLPAGTVLKEGSLKVSEIYTKLSGDKIITEITEGFSLTEATDSFEITFEKVTPYNGYLVEYVTTITDFELDKFVNEANYHVDGTDIPLSDDVTGITRSNPVVKEGKKINDHETEWFIDVNKNRQGLNDPVVNDQLPEYLNIKAGSMEVVRLNQNGSNWTEGAAVSIEDLGSFPLALGAMTSNDVYRIKFVTEIDWSKVNEGDYSKENTLSNTATLTDGGITYPATTVDVPFTRPNMLTKEGGATVNYDTKEVSWTIKLNEARHPLGTVTIEDSIPAGLIFNNASLSVKDEAGNDVDFNLSTTGSSTLGTDVSVVVENVGERVLTFEYKTTIEDFSKSSFNNAATANGIGIGNDGETDNKEISIPGNNYQKRNTAVNYNTKELSWEIEIDPRKEAIKELVIKDTYTHNGMILKPDSFVVIRVAGGTETTFVEGINNDYYVEALDGSFTNGFNIVLNDSMLPLANGKYFIRYKTSIDPQYEANGDTLIPHDGNNNQFKNRVDFDGTTITDVDITTGREPNPTLKEEVKAHGNKSGRLVHDVDGTIRAGWASGYDRQVEWTVHTNYLAQSFDEFVIKDTLQYEGTIIEDSVIVKEYLIADNGNIQTGSYVDTTKNYTVSVDGKNLTVNFDEAINERYVVVYRTTVPATSQLEYKNSVVVEADGTEYPYEATVRYTNHGEFLDKTSSVLNNQAYTGDEITWSVRVNGSLSIVDNPKIHDRMSAGQVYKEGSLIVTSLEAEGEVVWELGVDYSFDVEHLEGGETRLVITPTNQLRTTLKLEYTSIITAIESMTINNTIKLLGGDVEYSEEQSSSFNARQFSSVSGTWLPARGGILLSKLDESTNSPITNNRDSAEFELYMMINGNLHLVGNYKLDENGELRIGNLLLREYWLKEVKAPQGYELNTYDSEDEALIYVNVDRTVGNVNDPDLVDAGELTNARTLSSYTATKTWVNGPSEKPTIELQLYRRTNVNAQPEAYGDPVTLLSGETSHTWVDLEETNIQGDAYIYTVDELTVPENYAKTIDGTTITNTYVIPRIDVTATKTWINGPSERPNIELQLLRDGVTYGDPVTLTNGVTTYTWENLESTDINGNEFTYTVEEVGVPENYEKSESGLTVTNTYVIPRIDITATKEWINGPSERPDIELQLLRDGIAYGDPVTLTNGVTEYIWEDLDRTDINGHEYVYTVEEVDVPENYDMTVSDDGLTITNTYVIPTVDITGTKTWVNGPNERPDIELQLLRDGVAYGEPVTLTNGVTEYIWEDLDRTDINGREYVYTVEEVDVPENYEKSETGLSVTNTYIIPKIDITGTKVWVNGPKPEVQLQLLQDGAAFGEAITLSDGETEYTWVDLDRTDIDGNEYVYTVEEVNVPENYVMSVSDDGLTITNTYVIPKIDITGTKVWTDGPSERPDIELQLLRDGITYGDPVTLTNGVTEHIWEALDRTDIDGNEYVYTVEEVDVPENYHMILSDDGLTVTNVYVIPTTNITANKVWENGPTARPDIQLQLFRQRSIDTEPVAFGSPVTLTDGETEYTWDDMASTDINGRVYTYTVREVGVPENYEKSEIDLTVTNTYVIPKIDITGTKVWENGPKPEIQLQLLQDGVAFGEAITLSEGETEYTWVGLDRTDIDGHEYVYTVEEVDVPENYVMSVSDDGLTITNTYVIPTVDITGTKVWENGPKPEIQLQLLQDGVAFGEAITLSEGETEYTWIDLDRTDIDGNEYVYTVEEVDVPENYVMSVSDDGLTITNTYVIPLMDLNVTKIWINGPQARPSITLQLFRDGVEFGDSVILENGETDYTWYDLEVTDIDGNVYTYTVDEIDVPENYEKELSEDTLIITNTYHSPKIDVTGTKVWVGGTQPTIEIQLYRNGVAFGDPVVLESGTTTYTWTELDQYDLDGVVYIYTIDEVSVPNGYEKSISEDGLTITNEYVAEELPTTGISDTHTYVAYAMLMVGAIFILRPKKRFD